MKPRIAIALGLLALLIAPSLPALAGETGPAADSVMTMRVDGDITIDPQGQVTQYNVTTPVTPTIRNALDAAVRGWKFHTVEVDGQPANARSIMRVTLAARQASSGYAISVDNVTFRGVPEDEPLKAGEVRANVDAPAPLGVRIFAKSRQPVKYPRAAERAGISGSVLLSFRVGRDGSAAQVFAMQSTLYNVRASAGVMHELRKSFENNAVAAVKHWHFDVRLNGEEPTSTSLTRTMRVDYLSAGLTAEGAPGQWRVESRSAWRQVPWLVDQPAAQKIKVSDLDPGETMQVASAFQPPEGVIGKAL